jgi:hypothetical protein
VSQGRLRIVSGGQTGVDRAALDAALAAGLGCGGWCPAGRWAEDGEIDARYPLKPLASADPDDRTQRNVEDSDGTLVLEFASASPGTRLTIQYAEKCRKPLLVIDASRVPVEQAADRVGLFIQARRLAVLNVAGPRASEAPGAYAYARQLMERVFQHSDPRSKA